MNHDVMIINDRELARTRTFNWPAKSISQCSSAELMDAFVRLLAENGKLDEAAFFVRKSRMLHRRLLRPIAKAFFACPEWVLRTPPQLLFRHLRFLPAVLDLLVSAISGQGRLVGVRTEHDGRHLAEQRGSPHARAEDRCHPRQAGRHPPPRLLRRQIHDIHAEEVKGEAV